MYRNTLTLLLIIAFSLSFSFCQENNYNKIRLFYLGGQSNMDGYGYNRDLPDSLNQTYKNVWIFHGNTAGDQQPNGGLGKWEPLKPGHGVGFFSDGIKNNLSNRFGIELSFIKKLQAIYPNEKIALIKYSKGGTSIDGQAAGNYGSWDPDFKDGTGINQYDHFLNTIKNAFKNNDIDGDGKKDLLIPSGIIWMQGESDAAYTEDIANRYYVNLKRLMALIREKFNNNELPVVIGKISDSKQDKDNQVWNYGAIVQEAQEKYAKTDENAIIVRSTKNYKYSDPWHYNSEGYIDLGEKFAESLQLLLNK